MKKAIVPLLLVTLIASIVSQSKTMKACTGANPSTTVS